MSRKNKKLATLAIMLAYGGISVLASMAVGGSADAQGFVTDVAMMFAIPLGIGLANWVGPGPRWFR